MRSEGLGWGWPQHNAIPVGNLWRKCTANLPADIWSCCVLLGLAYLALFFFYLIIFPFLLVGSGPITTKDREASNHMPRLKLPTTMLPAWLVQICVDKTFRLSSQIKTEFVCRYCTRNVLYWIYILYYRILLTHIE